MAAVDLFSKEIIKRIRIADQAEILQPIEVGESHQMNELVFFVKPELFDIEEDLKILNSLELIKEKFDEFEVQVDGAAIVPGGILEKHGIMNRHYGFINQLSREASTIVDENTQQHIFELFEKEDSGKHRVLGGHEFLKAFDSDIETLSRVWFGKGANKLRSGFYFIQETFKGEPILLVNGFHPSQLQHFTREDHRIYLMLLHTNTDWEAMKFDLVGDTFPERAKPDSIRGRLFAEPGLYGQTDVGINTNGVHLSAGPFEAAFEVVNFFGPLINLDPTKTPPAAIKRAIDYGFAPELALKLLENPPVDNKDLFTYTENLNTDQALHYAKNVFNMD